MNYDPNPIDWYPLEIIVAIFKQSRCHTHLLMIFFARLYPNIDYHIYADKETDYSLLS